MEIVHHMLSSIIMQVELQLREDSGWKSAPLSSNVSGAIQYRVFNGVCYGIISVEYQHSNFYDMLATIPIKPKRELSFIGRSDDRGDTAFAIGTNGNINTMKGGDVGKYSLNATFSFIVE